MTHPATIAVGYGHIKRSCTPSFSSLDRTQGPLRPPYSPSLRPGSEGLSARLDTPTPATHSSLYKSYGRLSGFITRHGGLSPPPPDWHPRPPQQTRENLQVQATATASSPGSQASRPGHQTGTASTLHKSYGRLSGFITQQLELSLPPPDWHPRPPPNRLSPGDGTTVLTRQPGLSARPPGPKLEPTASGIPKSSPTSVLARPD